MHLRRLLPTLVALAVLAGACGGGDGADTAAADVVPPSPVAAQNPTPSPTPSPSPTPTPTGPPAPLTGEAMADEEALDRPAILVKIENTSASRPQSGLADADVVYEELVEGGVTRFVAIFHSDIPDQVGPIRSARLVDLGVAPAYRGVFVFSGARAEVIAELRASGMALQGDDGTTLHRNPSRPAPHNLYAQGDKLLAATERFELAPPEVPWAFDAMPPAGGTSTAGLDVRMSRVAVAGWSYDADAGLYRRAQNGEPFLVTGPDRVGAANVVVLGVEVGLGGCCDSSGSRYVTTQTEGEGAAVILRDGRAYEARWRKSAPAAQLELLTPDGGAFPLKPGSSWIHLAPVEALPSLGS